MNRSASPTETLLDFVGNSITKDMLLGRGYCRIEDGSVLDDEYSHVKELYWEVESEDLDDGLYNLQKGQGIPCRNDRRLH